MSSPSPSTSPTRTRPGSGGRHRPPHRPPSPNRPHGGRRGGNIYTDYGISGWPGYGIQPQTCNWNYQNDILNAKFKYNQCRDIAQSGSPLIPNSELETVCQWTLNQDLSNAQFNFNVCQNQNTSWSLFPTSPVFSIL